MSVRKYSFLFPLIVFVALLFFSSITNEASPDLQQKAPERIPINLDDIKAGPGVENADFKRQKLADKISSEYDKLKELFDSDSYDSKLGKNMAKILGKKATLVVGSDTYFGKKEIRDFWNGVWEKDKTVVFNLKWAFIVFEEKVTEEMDDYDHIAYEAFEFHIFKPEGKILKNQTGRGERSCRHTQICTCITR